MEEGDTEAEEVVTSLSDDVVGCMTSSSVSAVSSALLGGVSSSLTGSAAPGADILSFARIDSTESSAVAKEGGKEEEEE